MAFTDNFGNPKGLIGRLMLVMMEKEHFPMAQWALEQLELPLSGEIVDIGCGGGFREVARVLKSGGKFAVICNYGDPKVDWEKKVPCMTRYTEKQMAELMEGAGLRDVVTSTHDTLYIVQGIK